MWTSARKLFLSAMVVASVVATSSVTNAQATASGGDVLLTMPITVDGSLKNLQLLKGESFEEAATSFAKVNGLMDLDDSNKVRAVIDQLSTLLKDKMEEIQSTEPVAAEPKQTQTPTVEFVLPLTLNGQSSELQKFTGESSERAVERYLQALDFTLQVKQELFPQLVSLVNQKIQELQPPRNEVFSFTLTLDGKEAVARHFEGGDPVEEAKETLRSINVAEGEFFDRVVPQIANEIAKRVNGVGAAPVQEAPAQQQQPVLRALFSVPLTLNQQAVELMHYEGFSAADSVVKFLNDNGVTDAATINSYGPQLIELLEAKYAELVQQQQAAQQQQQQTAQQPARTPLVSVPVTLGDAAVTLNYYEGDNVEKTVEVFLQNNGLGQDPSFESFVTQLSALLRQRYQEMQAEQAKQRPEPMFAIPVTLGGNVFNVEYFEGQEPTDVASTFCSEKHEVLRRELGVEYDDNQLQECKNVLTSTLNNIINEASAKQQPAAQQQPQQTVGQSTTETTEATTPERALLFTMDIEVGEGKLVSLPFYRGDNPEEAARQFCAKYNVDVANVPALVGAIQEQLKN